MPCLTANRTTKIPLSTTAPTHLKLHATPLRNSLVVTAYGDDYVAINGRKLQRSLLLLPDRIDEDWGPTRFAALAQAHLAPLAALGCDVLLLGTGLKQHFPLASLLRPLIEAGRSIEIMDTQAACRTYNILLAEGRRVAAALILENIILENSAADTPDIPV